MKNINTNELQSKISRVLKDVERGNTYEVIRYSKPVAVILSEKEYRGLRNELDDIRANCRFCAKELRERLEKFKRKNNNK